MSEWKKMKLEEICLSISDGDHQPPPKSNTGVAFITISDIDSQNQINFDNVMHVPQEYYDSLDSKRKAQVGDILYSVVGSFGIPVIVKEPRQFVFQRHIAILRPDKERVIPGFLYYAMLNRDFYQRADMVAIGSAQRTISLSSLRDMVLTIPDIAIQEVIANRLSAYDDLIENNNRQIKLLEEAARRLYKEWFVDLHFPGYENCKIVDGVPEGWRKKTVGELIGKVPRTTQIPASCYKKNGEIPVIDQSKVFIAGYTDEKSALVDLHMPVIVFGDHTRILKYIRFPFARGADGTQLIVSRTTNMPQSLLYYGLVNIDLSNYHYARHFKYLKAESLLVPDKKIAELFDGYVSVLQEKIQDLRDEIYLSAEARDRLLPKLMSGEIEV